MRTRPLCLRPLCILVETYTWDKIILDWSHTQSIEQFYSHCRTPFSSCSIFKFLRSCWIFLGFVIISYFFKYWCLISFSLSHYHDYADNQRLYVILLLKRKKLKKYYKKVLILRYFFLKNEKSLIFFFSKTISADKKNKCVNLLNIFLTLTINKFKFR